LVVEETSGLLHDLAHGGVVLAAVWKGHHRLVHRQL
jgi:hypothetical protein